jgi:hypothetical protein
MHRNFLVWEFPESEFSQYLPEIFLPNGGKR